MHSLKLLSIKLKLIEWCFEYNLFYEGVTHRTEIRNYSVGFLYCVKLCEKEGESCTAFIFNKRVERANETINNKIKNIYTSFCTLMTNVTNSVARNIESSYTDILVSGKKCKAYEPFKTNFDAGMTY